MARRKKHMKLPNGYGTVAYLGKGRRRPYAAYPPVTAFTLDGSPIRSKAIGYAADWYGAYDLLVAWKNGITPANSQAVAQRPSRPSAKRKGPTFAEVYERYYTDKYETNTSKKYSKASQNSTRAAFKNCSALHDRELASLRYEDLQEIVDSCPLKHASLELIVNLIKQIYKYALKYEIVDKDYAQWLEIKKADDDEHGVPFTDEELRILWKHQDNKTVELLLIMIYSGYRIAAWKDMKVDLKNWYFQGGVKTAASKNRIVPIHSAIQHLVQNRMNKYNCILPVSPNAVRHSMQEILPSIGVSLHTPHDCRHTFSMLCEKYQVAENDRKRLLGHTFEDITNKVYGHRSITELRAEIEKIRVPD